MIDTKVMTDEARFMEWWEGDLSSVDDDFIHAAWFAALALERARVSEIADRIEALFNDPGATIGIETEESVLELLKELRRG